MSILCLDPGNKLTAYLVYEPSTKEVLTFGKVANEHVVDFIEECKKPNGPTMLICEFPHERHQLASDELFRTCFWAGQFVRQWGAINYCLVDRKDIKMHLTGRTNTTDKHIQFALRVRFNEPPAPRRPKGKLEGVSKDVWAALAVAVYWSEVKYGRR